MRIAFFSTMFGMPWGGSEELWSRAAHVLMARGHEVCANVAGVNGPAEQLQRLAEAGARIRRRPRPLVGRTLRRAWQKLGVGRCRELRWLRRARPDLVLISAGYHTDDPIVSAACRALKVPYGIVVQAAGPDHQIDPRNLADFRDAYRHAERVFFVSDQNRDIVEASLGEHLPQAELVDNPFNVRAEAAPPWPNPGEPWRLACVARIYFPSKGQDIIVQLVQMPKWRARPLQVVLWGADGGSERQARELVAAHGLDNQVLFGGFAHDIESLWSEHHGLLLPSRFEGNPLALIEAMMCGRVPIITDVGRAAELIDDNRSGFIAPAATVESVDDAMERAWQRRHEWQAIGASAAAAIRQRHSLRPAEDFAERLLAVAAQADRRRMAA
jgi:glycosyltransferase involved in cell wall biosynthesis